MASATMSLIWFISSGAGVVGGASWSICSDDVTVALAVADGQAGMGELLSCS